ncbi:MAG: DNA polymerase III subunit gamma/tau [Acidobacteriota bacterium]
MAHLALARKYRPLTFDQIIGQDVLVRTLKNALATGKIHPAYIFSGIRGVGKTTAARIFAKGLNCARGVTADPCLECPSCKEIALSTSMDVLEIDGATHTKAEEARDLTQVARYSPARDRFRVFLIDEVHMLSKPAFNALLKTLEEPPSHVVFLLATTEPDKIPETIHSRAQHFQFRRVPPALVSRYLQKVADEEGITLEPAARDLVAHCGEGSVRDSLTLLDRLLAYSGGEITEELASDVLGAAGRESLFAFCDTLADEDVPAVLNRIDELFDKGQDLKRFLFDLGNHVRRLLRERLAPGVSGGGDEPAETAERYRAQASRFSPEELMRLMDLLAGTQQKIRSAPDPQALFELQLVKAACLPRIVPLEVLLGGDPDAGAGAPPAPSGASSPPRPREADRAAEPPVQSPPAPEKMRERADPAPQAGESPERIENFRRISGEALALARPALTGARIFVDEEGVLHVVCHNGSATGHTYLSGPERIAVLKKAALEAGLSGRVVVERDDSEAPLGFSPEVREQEPDPVQEDETIRNVVKVLGGRVLKVTPLASEDSAGEDNDAEHE